MSTYKKNHSKENIKSSGEVFTPEWLIEEMFAQLPDIYFKNANLKILDNSCGSGNFLVKALEYRLKNGISREDAIKNIYGVELNNDNVEECIKRMAGDSPSDEILEILKKNITCADSLTYDYPKNYI